MGVTTTHFNIGKPISELTITAGNRGIRPGDRGVALSVETSAVVKCEINLRIHIEIRLSCSCMVLRLGGYLFAVFESPIITAIVDGVTSALSIGRYTHAEESDPGCGVLDGSCGGLICQS